MDVSICIVSWNRPQELQCLLRSIDDNLQQGPVREILILDNGSSPPYELTSVPDALADKLRLIRSHANLGCPAGRNLLAREAFAPLVFFIDDDGVIEKESDLSSALDWLSSDPTLMAVTGLVTEDHRTRMRTPWRFRKNSLYAATRKNAPGLIGGCVILKREHFLALGGFSDSGRYGGEEALLSIQALLAGRSFGFTTDFELAHEPSPKGRLTTTEVGVANLANRLEMARMFGFPMRLSLQLSATVSNLRRGGIRNVATTVKRFKRQPKRPMRSNENLIRVRNWKTLRTLGWRGWI